MSKFIGLNDTTKNILNWLSCDKLFFCGEMYVFLLVHECFNMVCDCEGG